MEYHAVDHFVSQATPLIRTILKGQIKLPKTCLIIQLKVDCERQQRPWSPFRRESLSVRVTKPTFLR